MNKNVLIKLQYKDNKKEFSMLKTKTINTFS